MFQIVLAACSNFFANIFSANNGEKSQQSLIVLEDIRALDFKHLLQFMYHGQVDIDRYGNIGLSFQKRDTKLLCGSAMMPRQKLF